MKTLLYNSKYWFCVIKNRNMEIFINILYIIINETQFNSTF